MCGGRAPRQKGNRAEAAIVRFLVSRGLTAQRVPLSGSVRGRFSGDISLDLLGIERRGEVKVRSNGFATLYRWLGTNDFLVIKGDRREPLIVCPMWFASEVAAVAEKKEEEETRKAIPHRTRFDVSSSTSNQGS
jgi:hypothetical protein